MATKLNGQRFKGYDEYLLDDGTIVYHDVDSGEDVESELREVPIGSLLLTPKQLAAQKAYKERRQKMESQKKELGEYIYTHSSEGAFSDLSADIMARAAFLSTYVSFGTDELWRTRYKRLSRKDLPSVMKLSTPTANRFWREVKDKYFRRDNDGFLHTVGQSFIKGKLEAPAYSEYQRLYIATLREIYTKIPTTQHKLLGYAIKMLPYLNFEFNALCHNPMETMRDKIIPMTVSEFCEIVGYDKTHAADLAKEYGELTFTVKERKEVFCKAYTPEQVANLLDAVEREGEPIRAGVTLAVCYGLRRSELLGLRWKDIDFEARTLCVRNTVTKYRDLVIEAEQTKTKKSHRTIDLIESTIPYLSQLKRAQEESGLVLDKVCVWPDGRAVRPDYITARTRRIMEKYGLEHIRVHDLRHTAATLLATRATLKQVQEFLGHEDISTTGNIYAHLMDRDRKVTSDIMDGVLRNSVLCSEKCSESVKA